MTPEIRRLLAIRREQHTQALRGWREPHGFLLPTEPDADERRRIRDCLHAALTEISLMESALLAPPAAPPPTEGWTCQAKKTADPLQDCTWPSCGCDPHAEKVLTALQEAGRLLCLGELREGGEVICHCDHGHDGVCGYQATAAPPPADPPPVGRSDEYHLSMAALDNYPIDDGLPKSTSVVFRIHQLGHAWKALLAGHPPTEAPIPLNEAQERAAQEWAADDRLWTTQETVAFNLRTFAREILLRATTVAPRSGDQNPEQKPTQK